MKKHIHADFALPDTADSNPGIKEFFTTAFGENPGPYHIVVNRVTYLAGIIPLTDEIQTAVYGSFSIAKKSAERRSVDNDAGCGGDSMRLVFGAMLGLAYGRKLKRMSFEEIVQVGAENVASFNSTNKKIKDDFTKVYGEEALNELRGCLSVLAGDKANHGNFETLRVV